MNTPLKNIKHEKFALLVLEGLSLPKAYIAAGFRARGHSAEVLASRLLKKVEVAARLEALKRETASQAVASRKETLEILSAIARGQGVAVTQGKDGPETLGVTWPARMAAIKQLCVLEGWEKQTEAVQDSGLTELSRHFDRLRGERERHAN